MFVLGEGSIALEEALIFAATASGTNGFGAINAAQASTCVSPAQLLRATPQGYGQALAGDRGCLASDVASDTRTLYGGEGFLVSLALALSDLMSHKTSIDSLFLDEGFGSLDGYTLEIALAELD